MSFFQRSFQTDDEVKVLVRMSSSERMELVDRSLRGLMLIKRKNGAPKWVLKYQCPRTFQKRSLPVGDYADVHLHEARQRGMAIIRQEYGSEQFELIQLPSGVEGTVTSDQRSNQDLGLSFDEMTGKSADRGGDAGDVAAVGLATVSEDKGDKVAGGVVSGGVLLRGDKGACGKEGKGSQGDVRKLEIESRSVSTVKTPFITLNQFYLDHYLPYIKMAKRSWTTDVSVLGNHVLPLLGGYAMIDLKPFMVKEMVQVLVKKGLSASTCNRALIILRFMFNCGLRWEILPKVENPCQKVKELALNNKKERFLNGAEINALKLELSKSRNKFLPYIVQLLILTGCRRGEALHAKIQHFDLGRGDWVVPLPKAGYARHIPLNEMAIQTIRAAIQFKKDYNQTCRESHFLFPNPSTGEPFRQIFYSWDKARKAAHVEQVRMHDLRHSFASAMVNSGMTLYDVKEILGHSNIRTTERYAHLSNARLRHAAESVTAFYDNQDWIGSEVEKPE